jgi:hypothetical protein
MPILVKEFDDAPSPLACHWDSRSPTHSRVPTTSKLHHRASHCRRRRRASRCQKARGGGGDGPGWPPPNSVTSAPNTNLGLERSHEKLWPVMSRMDLPRWWMRDQFHRMPHTLRGSCRCWSTPPQCRRRRWWQGQKGTCCHKQPPVSWS